jgi:hypothetical protein
MKFTDIKTSREGRFSIGIEEQTGKFYVSIPVSNPYVDYEEYYEISQDAFKEFDSDMTKALRFAQECKERKNDHLLIQPPGKFRGVAQ